jgi:hypothetical protein
VTLPIKPMQPTLVRESFHRPGWIYEEKYDGWRMLAFKEGESVKLVSQNDRTALSSSVALSAMSPSTRRTGQRGAQRSTGGHVRAKTARRV